MFDLYTDASNRVEANSRSPCSTPFFSNGCIEFDSGLITTKILRDDPKTLLIDFSNYSPKCHITFETVVIWIDEFIKKLEEISDRKTDYISFDVNVSTDLHDEKDCEHYYRCQKTRVCNNLIISHSGSRNYSGYPRKSSVTCAVQFNLNELKKALAVFHGIEENEGGFNMKSFGKMFSGLEFGVNKDPNIKSTLTGIVVKGPTGEWFAFDPATRTRKNIMGMKFGDFPIVLIPVKTLTVGRLIKRDQKYYWVQSVNNDNTFTGVNAMTGGVETFVLTESIIPGFNFFTEVIAFDAKTLMDPASNQNMGGNVLGAMLMMKMMDDGGKAEFSLDDINDDSFNGLGMFMPMLLASKDGNLGITNPDGSPNIMMMMMMFGSGDGGVNDYMKMTLLSSLLGNGTTPNPLGDIMNGFGGNVTGQNSSTPHAENVGGFVCSNCGKEYSDPSVHYCPDCGGKVISSAIICSKCGTQLKNGAKFCHVCGTKVGALTCPECGNEVSHGDKFCPNCGHDLSKKPTSSAPTVSLKKPARKKVSLAKNTTPNQNPTNS